MTAGPLMNWDDSTTMVAEALRDSLSLSVTTRLAMYVPSSILVVLGQEYLPGRVGTASGVTLGLAVSVGGVLTPALGFVADHTSLRFAMGLLVLVPIIATPLALSLPREFKKTR